MSRCSLDYKHCSGGLHSSTALSYYLPHHSRVLFERSDLPAKHKSRVERWSSGRVKGAKIGKGFVPKNLCEDLHVGIGTVNL